MASERPFKVDGVAIPTPTSYVFNVEDLSSEGTGRTLDGVMHKDVVAVKDYYECTWKGLSWEDTALLLNAIDGKEQVAFTHADPRVANQFITGQYYVGKRGGTAMNLKNPKKVWSDISLTFTQI